MDVPNIGNVAQAAAISPERSSPVPPIAPRALPVVTPTEREAKRAVDILSRAAQSLSRDLQFTLDKSSGKMVVRVVDTQTNELIRQIPTEEALAISKAIDRLQGLIVRQKA